MKGPGQTGLEKHALLELIKSSSNRLAGSTQTVKGEAEDLASFTPQPADKKKRSLSEGLEGRKKEIYLYLIWSQWASRQVQSMYRPLSRSILLGRQAP